MSVDHCEAAEFTGRMICPRCDLEWPGDFWTTVRPACKETASPPIGIAEMIRALTYSATICLHSQQVAITAKYRDEPYRPELRRAAVLQAAGALLQRVHDDPDIMSILRASRR